MYEELIYRLENAAGGPEGIKMARDAAAAITALQAENDKKDKHIARLETELSAWKQAVDLVGKSYYTVYDGEDEASIGAIDAVEFREDGIFLMDNGEICRLDEVGQSVEGKAVFLTCAEAEAAIGGGQT